LQSIRKSIKTNSISARVLCLVSTEGNHNKALAETTPLGFSLMGGEAIGSFYEYAQEQIDETAFENRYSEKLYMGSASGRQKAYEDACRERERNGFR
jgi:hypothetical protein